MKESYDVIFEAARALNPSQTPASWGVVLSWALGGQDPLDKVWAFASTQEAPHWHYVSYGLTNPAVVKAEPGDRESGVGFELTLRVKREASESEAPLWPVTRLQDLAWAILKHNMHIRPGHWLALQKSITGGQPATKLCGWYVEEDTTLPRMKSASGEFSAYQLIGIGASDIGACENGGAEALEKKLRALSPLGIIDLSRDSII